MTKKTQKLRKVLTLAACAVLLVSVTIVGTVAYLTSQDEVTNTFTVGNVVITLDELDVDNSTEGENDRDKANEYHLLPGHPYIKDPTIHVAEGSEDCWLFVKIDNGIAQIEDAGNTGNTIAAQMAAKGWTLVDGKTNVYAYERIVSAEEDVVVFESFKIAGNVSNETLASYADAEIVVTAYAVQADGLATAADAWTAAPKADW